MKKCRKAYDRFKLQKKQKHNDVNYNAFLQHVEGNEIEDMSSIS